MVGFASREGATGERVLGPRALLVLAYVVPGLTYPLWHLFAPKGSQDPWIVWWLIGACFLALGLPSLRFAWFRDRLNYLYSICAFLVTAHLFVLAHLNHMEPFFGVGSTLAVFSTAMLMTSQRLLVWYSGFVTLLAAALYAAGPNPLKVAYWGGMFAPLIFYYQRLGAELDAAALQRRYNENLEREVEERTRELSDANDRLETEIAQRERLEEELRLSNKMEALGRMAGGLAHDFNNLFTTIGVYSEFLLQGLPQDSELRSEAEQIQRTTRQASSLTRQLLTLSRRGFVETTVFELNEVIGEVIPVLERILGEDVELSCRLAERPIFLQANRGQIEQVLLNLVINARDAMPRGGNLQLETWTCSAEDLPFADPGDEPREPEYLALAVADDGIGMDAETRARAFEPFFTTKAGDRGTGLGLSIVYGIVRQSGGQLRLLSAPAKGTRFEIYWPVAHDEADRSEPEAHSLMVRGHDERLLLVEDQQELREALSRVLQDAGYNVCLAADGEQALDLALEPGAEFDLVVSDVVMPRMSGLDLAEHLAAAKPRIKVLLISGHMSHPSLRDREVPLGVALLAKPFEPGDLTAKVRELLGDPVN
jgi:signal transduction histidine kinase/CheY-like chemotaxis protein